MLSGKLDVQLKMLKASLYQGSASLSFNFRQSFPLSHKWSFKTCSFWALIRKFSSFKFFKLQKYRYFRSLYALFLNFRSRYGFKTYIRRAIALRQIKYFSLRCGQFMGEKTVTLWCKSQRLSLKAYVEE